MAVLNYKNVYTVIDRAQGQKAVWVRIGAAFVNRDGSLNVKLDALPLNGTLQIRDRDPEDRQEREPDRDDQGRPMREPPPSRPNAATHRTRQDDRGRR